MSRSAVIALVLAACGAPAHPSHGDENSAIIDRFSGRAGHLMVRDARRALPGPGEPIDLDRPPFLTQGLGPDGKPVRYYNFDIQSPVPARRYRFTRAGRREPLEGQLDVIDVLPGGAGYSDFWQIVWVEVPDAYVPGTITSFAQLRNLRLAPTDRAVNCPLVPRGTSAHEAHGVAPAVEQEVWFRGTRVTCLAFGGELALDGGRVPTSPIYVTFASEAGPSSGFRTEGVTKQTHNVVLSVPGDTAYSPLWDVHIYDRRAFDLVHDEASALKARLAAHGPLVNCPIQSVGEP